MILSIIAIVLFEILFNVFFVLYLTTFNIVFLFLAIIFVLMAFSTPFIRYRIEAKREHKELLKKLAPLWSKG